MAVKRMLFGRSLMWLAGVALPAAPLLQSRLREAARALMFGVSGSFILSALFLAMLYGSFAYLVDNGLSPALAFLLVGGAAFFAGGALILLSLREIRRAASIKDDLSLFADHPLDSLKRAATQLPLVNPLKEAGGGVKDIASAFIDGLMNGTRTEQPRAVRESTVIRPFVHAEFEAGLKPRDETKTARREGRAFL